MVSNRKTILVVCAVIIIVTHAVQVIICTHQIHLQAGRQEHAAETGIWQMQKYNGNVIAGSSSSQLLVFAQLKVGSNGRVGMFICWRPSYGGAPSQC